MSFRNKAFFNRSLAGFCYILIIACGWIYFLQCYLLLCAQNLMLPTLLLYMVFTIWSHHRVCYFLYGRYAQISLYCVCVLLGMLFFFLSSDLIVHAAQIPPKSPSPDPSVNLSQQVIERTQRSDFSITSSDLRFDGVLSALPAYNIFSQNVVNTEHVVNEEDGTKVIIDRTDATNNLDFMRRQSLNISPKNCFSDKTMRGLIAYLKSEGLDDARIHNLLKALPNHPIALNVFRFADGTVEFRASILTHSSKHGNFPISNVDLSGRPRTQFMSKSIPVPASFLSSHTPGVAMSCSSRLPISPELIDNFSILKPHTKFYPTNGCFHVITHQNTSTASVLKSIGLLKHIKKN